MNVMGANNNRGGFVIVCTYAKEKLRSGCRTLKLEDGMDRERSNSECTLFLLVLIVKALL